MTAQSFTPSGPGKQPFSVAGRRVLVVGAARSGLAAAELLVARGAHVTLTDTSATVPGEDRLRAIGVALDLNGHDNRLFTSADLIVTSPGVPPELSPLVAARAHGVPIVGELELASRWLRGRVVAITGTKGKSTTTTLVGKMLEASGRRVLVGGNIGVPLSAHVDQSTPETLHVVEASSFQLEATDTFHPWIAAMLNISPDHLDRHPDEAAYGRAKARIFANQEPGDWAVLNADHPETLALAQGTKAKVLTYSATRALDWGVFVRDGVVWQRTSEGDVALVPLSSVRLRGSHMTSNVVAASAISHLAGASPDGMTQALGSFTGLEHVMEPVADIDGVRFVNDSKATNVDAAAHRSRASTALSRSWVASTRGADSRTWRRRSLGMAEPSWPSGRRGRSCAPVSRRRCQWWTPAQWPKPSVRRTPSRNRTGSCCWRRPARASTCSRTMPPAVGRSRRRCGRSTAERQGV